jgi:hypothetical protein
MYLHNCTWLFMLLLLLLLSAAAEESLLLPQPHLQGVLT